MIGEHLSIQKIFDLPKWERLQDSLASVTKLAILTVDYKGNAVTSHSGCQSFCKAVRQDEDLLPYCQKCDSRGGLEAVRSNKPYIYLCHYNIIDIAVPVIIDDKYIGAVMAGQVRLSDPSGSAELEQILTSKNRKLYSEKWEKLKDHYADLPVMSYQEIVTIAGMLSLLCSYIVEEALNKNLIVEMFEKASSSGTGASPRLSDILPGYTMKNLENVRKEMTHILAGAYLGAEEEEGERCANPVLKPAFDYLYAHKSESVPLKKMAELCHISPSYFSRLFAKETGESYSGYTARLKIKWAKQLLENTDMPVAQISGELGFNEPGYFIKTFKKYEEITPAVYRKYYKS
ncbi:PocR ligand-binding domain-containing protein [Saccharibacillus alkalitolerans]|uniref:Helix-turn-helix domain-containing protein n=1 Tax=Saccharibacillus alkalitolerans TaxID=2705290 RepID=A0ABX0F3K4_9BACL|nr:PocR ligand-binding domain-containing protein [Saccharibacillus alkalitolerans]NGZ75065.1 helix-turn-helix domain-containing protein [Saccharibacillus alkalitolerans]